MKKYFNLIIAILSLTLAFNACETDLDNPVSKVYSPLADFSVDNKDPLVCDAENAADTIFIFSWKAADLGSNVSCRYSIQFDVDGNNFASPYEISLGTNVFEKHITSSEMNALMYTLEQPTNVPTDLEVRVKAWPVVLGSSTPELPIAMSENKVTVNITSYARPPLHLIGSMFDNYWDGTPNFWNINNYEYVMFRDNALSVNIYTARFKAVDGSGLVGDMKFVEDKVTDWDKVYGKSGEGRLLQGNGGGNISDITETGYYTVTVDVAEMIYTITEYDASNATTYAGIELTGTGVGSAVVLKQTYYDPHMWVADNVSISAGKVKFQSGSSSWGDSNFPWGKGTSDGEDITITNGGNYFVKFSDLTGHYIFYKK